MRILLFFSLIIFLSNCASVEIAKEVTKATRSIKTSVTNIIKNSSNDNIEELAKNKKDDKKIINYEIANLEKEKKEKEKIIIEQKNKTVLNFLDKNSDEVRLMIGNYTLMRIDGNTRTTRFDNNYCQLFLFSNAESKNAEVKYFEIRNKKGNLIVESEKIKNCYKNFKLI
jgi:hypothetical protein